LGKTLTIADKVRELLATEPTWTHAKIALHCGCSVGWVKTVSSRAGHRQLSLEPRIQALEQTVKDILEHLNRSEKRTKVSTTYTLSPRQSLRIHGKTSLDDSGAHPIIARP
jgi:hypothetical protein